MSIILRLVALKLLMDRWRGRVRRGSSGRNASDSRYQREHDRPDQGDCPEYVDTRGAVTHGTGRKATQVVESPLELDAGDWRLTLRQTLSEIKEDRVTFAAAAIAFYLFLAIFPALIALVGILGMANIDASGLIESLRSTLPGGAGRALTNAIARADNPSQAASLTAAISGLAVAIWSASSGMASLQTGLNVAYDVPVERRFLKKRAVALVLLAATLILGGVPSPIFTLGERPVYTVVGWVFTIAAVIILFSIYYYLGPNRDSPTWQWLTLGGVAGAVLWITASISFGFYVANFNNYGKTYGPLAGVVVLVLWLYLSAIAVLVGAELNSELERRGESRRRT